MIAISRWSSVLILALAFLLRVAVLDLKPAHFDEGINGQFIDGMKSQGFYRYDPANYHGPLHFYTLFVGQTLFGRSLWVLRMPTVLLGTAAVAMVLALRRFFPARACVIGALALAISPGMVFYSRYAIHESWLPFFLLVATYGAFGLMQGGRRRADMWALGLGVTGLILTKETYIIHVGCALLTLPCLWVLEQLLPAPVTDQSVGIPPVDSPSSRPMTEDIIKVCAACLGLIVLFYSGFFMNWKGVSGLWECMFEWAHTGMRGDETDPAKLTGHEKPWFYWCYLLVRYEWPLLLGFLITPFMVMPRWRRAWIPVVVLCATVLILAVRSMLETNGLPTEGWRSLLNLALEGGNSLVQVLAICIEIILAASALALVIMLTRKLPGESRLQRFLGIYGTGVLVAYSIVAYKTPWCIISMLWPFALMLGLALHHLASQTDARVIGVIGLLLGGTNAAKSYRLNFVNPTDETEPYVYVQTFPDIKNLLNPLKTLVTQSPSNYQLRGAIYSEAQPLVWELGDFPNISYLPSDQQLDSYDSDFLIIPESRVEEVESKLNEVYYKDPFHTRGSGVKCCLYMKVSRFRKALPTRAANFFPIPPVPLPPTVPRPTVPRAASQPAPQP